MAQQDNSVLPFVSRSSGLEDPLKQGFRKHSSIYAVVLQPPVHGTQSELGGCFPSSPEERDSEADLEMSSPDFIHDVLPELQSGACAS